MSYNLQLAIVNKQVISGIQFSLNKFIDYSLQCFLLQNAH